MLSLRLKVACCITRRAYRKAFSETRRKVSCLASEAHAAPYGELRKHIRQAMAHYQNALEVYRMGRQGLICDEKLLAKWMARYRQAQLAFDKGGALMPAPSGKRCLAPSLLVPLIFRQAAKEVAKAKEIWDCYYAAP